MQASNFYSHPGFERAGLRRRDTAWIVERLADPGSLFVPVWRNQNLVIELDGGEPRAVVLDTDRITGIIGRNTEDRLAGGELVFLGVIEERAHFALDVSPIEAPLEMLHSPALAASGTPAATVRFADLRQVGPRIDRREGALLALARAMMFWHARHRYCGLCGSPTRSEEAGHMRRCTDPGCNTMHFPRTDPAVIMLGFVAEARSTEVIIDYGELEDARWFHRDWLLSHVDDDAFRLPRLDSIARRLIEDWLHGR